MSFSHVFLKVLWREAKERRFELQGNVLNMNGTFSASRERFEHQGNVFSIKETFWTWIERFEHQETSKLRSLLHERNLDPLDDMKTKKTVKNIKTFWIESFHLLFAPVFLRSPGLSSLERLFWTVFDDSSQTELRPPWTFWGVFLEPTVISHG